MTVLVGIRCKDGVVIGSDSAATFGSNGQMTIGQQAVQKVQVIADHIVHAGTGAVGIAQLIVDSLARGWQEGAFKNLRTSAQLAHVIGQRISQIVGPYFQTAQMQRHITGEASATLCKSLVAMRVANRYELFQFDFNGAPEIASGQLPFVALGSGQAIADPFLALLKRLLWPDSEPTVAEGRLAVVWTIDHVRRTNPGGVGGPIQLATLSNQPDEVKFVDDAEVDEHLQAIESALQTMVSQIKGVTPNPIAPVPPNFPAPIAVGDPPPAA